MAGEALPLSAWLARLSVLELEGLAVTASYTRGLSLEEPLNSRVRGNLGARLRALRCITRAPDCAGCREVAVCDYARIFETPSAVVAGAHGSHGTHPFWLRGLPAVERLSAGTKVVARLFAAGFARPTLPYLDVALRGALEDTGAVAGFARPFKLGLAGPWPEATTWRLTAVTPLAVHADPAQCAKDCPEAPWLAVLVRAGLRRLGALGAAYVPGWTRARAGVPDLRGVVLEEGGLAPWSSERYSARQRRSVPLEGLTGSAVVRGEALRELGALWGLLSVVSVGKSTALGFGELRAEPLDG